MISSSSFDFSLVYAQLTSFANLSNFWSLFNTAFGSSYNSAKAATLRSQWQSGNFSQFPQIEIVSSNVLGSANGAYSASTNKIYLSDRFVATAGRVSLEAVLLEEFGHFVDAQVNRSDSAGDEGAIFSALVLGESLDANTLQALKAEEDQATITVNGQVIQVELQNFTGTDRADTIFGTPGGDSISGGAGDDFIDGRAGSDTILGGDGNDTIDGSAGDDFIDGGAGNNSIRGGDGRDQISGGDGNDTIDGGDGINDINGGAGNDIINSAGNNLIDGGTGNDFISVGSRSIIFGGFGNDTIIGSPGSDNITGGSIGDIFGDGDDFIDGGDGDDFIDGGTTGNDTINGGDGDDFIFGGNGNDSLLGGDGDDTFFGSQGNDVIQGGSGSNTADYSGLKQAITIKTLGVVTKAGNLGTDSLVSIQNVIGTRFDDTITGDSGNNLLVGDAGKDTINGGDGNDSLFGGSGDDTFLGSQGNDVINGRSAPNTRDDGLPDSNTADYSLLGQAITLKPFGVVEKGGFGKDSLVNIQKIIASNLPNDTIDASTNSFGITANLATNICSPFPLVFNFENVIGTKFNDTITGDSGKNLLVGGEGNDTISGGEGNDTIDGGEGNDIIDGDVGNDNIDGGAGNDRLFGGADNDFIRGRDGNDTISGDNGNDLIFGDDGNDTISGGDGNDLIFGDNGNDTISGDAGDDTINGGDGDDTFLGSKGDDKLNGDSGSNTADYSLLGQAITLKPFGVVEKAGGFGKDSLVKIQKIIASTTSFNDTIDASTTDVPSTGITANLATNSLTVKGSGSSLPLSFQVFLFENVIGTKFDDTITGNILNNLLVGGAGNDIIDGGIGDDSLVGGDGDDTFIGSKGDDKINGDSGSNTADYSLLGQAITLKPFGVVEKAGNLGKDSLVKIQKIIASNLPNDTIDASTTPAPSIGITANLGAGTLTVKGSGSSLPLNFQVSNFENVIGTKFDDTITGDSGKNLLVGGDGKDTISGGEGNDTIDGGAGNDKIDGGIGDDSLVGGDGDDTFIGSKGDDKINGDSGSNTADYSLLEQAITLKPFGVVEKAGNLGTDSLVKIQKIIASNLPDDTIDASTTPAPSTGITANLGTGTLTVKGSGSSLPLKFQVSNFENVIGTNFDDGITGDNGNNRLIGNAGKDTLTGGAGNDFLNGGDGNDSLTGGVGNDSLIGGLGADKFVFTNPTEGIDIIQDFSIAEGDKIQISRFPNGGALNQFNYNFLSGNLSFGSNVFVTLQNKPADFTVALGIQLL